MKRITVLFAPLQARLNSLPQRDRRALLALCVFLLVVCGWSFVWQPLTRARADAMGAYQSALADFAWIQQHESEIKAPAAGSTGNAGAPLLGVVTHAATPFELNISRADPQQDGSIHVTLENAGFDKLLSWLETLQREHAVSVSSAVVDEVPTQSGAVNAKLVLRR